MLELLQRATHTVVPTAAKCVRYRQEKSWYPLHFRDVVLLELLDPAHLSLGEGSARLLEV